VTDYRRIASRVGTWEPAAPLSTAPDGGRASNNAASVNVAPRKNTLVRTGPPPRRTGRNDALPRRPAGGAVDRSPRAAAVRSPSGARPPAATGPGSRAARRPPAERRCRWSSGGSRFVSLSSRPAGTGRGCSANSPASWMTATSTTGTCPPGAPLALAGDVTPGPVGRQRPLPARHAPPRGAPTRFEGSRAGEAPGRLAVRQLTAPCHPRRRLLVTTDRAAQVHEV
jgi:hypothetical protein